MKFYEIHGFRVSGEKVRFTRADESDLVRLNELVNEPEIARYLNLIPPVPFQKTLDFWMFIQDRGSLLWCIRDGAGTVGAIGVIHGEPGTKISHVAVFFIYLEPACRGREWEKKLFVSLNTR